MIEEARKYGENLGKEIGKEETACKMRKKGFDIKTIMELTGLSKEKILNL